MQTPVRLILVGGFLGAGKTTLLARAARYFVEHGKRVVLITNDQAGGLVDTLSLDAAGFRVREIAGGCFCCRFDQLVDTAEQVLDEFEPDIILGEPVGSCTDISATVLQPLKELYGGRFQLAPFTVLADPARLGEMLEGGDSPLPAAVGYIFNKQLEEADAIVVNKVDSVQETRLSALLDAVGRRFPAVPVLALSAREGRGFSDWLGFVSRGNAGGGRVAAVDYDTYAAGEALLGWLNAVVRLGAEAGGDWCGIARGFLENVREGCRARGGEIAHLKILLQTPQRIVMGNLTANQEIPAIREEASAGRSAGEGVLTVNARVRLEPEALESVVRGALDAIIEQGIAVDIATLERFKPGRPRPRFRFDAPVS